MSRVKSVSQRLRKAVKELADMLDVEPVEIHKLMVRKLERKQ